MSVNILVYILLFPINLHFVHVFFVNCVMFFGVFLGFFYEMHCFKWRRHKVAINYALGL